MRITKINIPDIQELNDGIQEVKMDRLGPVVLIAGRNGSGKTRLLNKLSYCVINRPSRQETLTLHQNIYSYQNAINNDPNSPSISTWTRELKASNYRLRIIDYIEFSEEAEIHSVVNFVPKNLTLIDCNQLTKDALMESASEINNIGINYLASGTLSRIQYEQDKYWNAQHPLSDAPDDEKNEISKSYESLNRLIASFLGSTLSRTTDGSAQLFGLPLGKANLSDGQKVLLQLCLAIHAQEVSLSNLILLMDEPENHLHPSALIEVIDKIREQIHEGQLWISTHSITLLSHLDTASIWFMENGTITYAGRQPERVLQGLLGTDEEISRLADFLNLPAHFASNQFAYECLFQPHAIQTDIKDAQTTQIRDEIRKNYVGEKLRVLDYGAGKGRLADAIYYADEITEKAEIYQWLDYVAFDPCTEDMEYCQAAIERIYGSYQHRYYNSETHLQSELDQRSIDVIVMCNVLHEIQPKDWISLFSPEGVIMSLLKDSGNLLLVEDQLVPVGEKPHQNGFIVLSMLQLKKLFQISENDPGFSSKDARGDMRLMAYQISKSCIARISSESRKEALSSLITQAKREIKRLREEPPNYKNGKLHGFWAQQLANAQLCIDEL